MEHIKDILERTKQEIQQITISMDGQGDVAPDKYDDEDHTEEKRIAREKLRKERERLMLLEYQRDTLEERNRAMMKNSNLGRRFASRTFENFDRQYQPIAYDTCLKYAVEFEKNNGQGLMLMGNPGTGKTHLAAAITNYVIGIGVAAKFGNFIDLLNDIKKSFHSDEDVVRELKRIPLLVIDDLGKERRSEWSEMILYDVINGRYEDYMPTIVTTNLTPKQIEERFGEATFSRLFEMCAGIVVQGKDVRREVADWNV